MMKSRNPFQLFQAVVLCSFVLLVASPAARPAAAAGDKAAPDPVKIDESIRRGVEFIIRMQYIDGSWTKNVTSCAGYTALDALALAKAGIAHDHPAIQKAVNFISAAR